MSNSYNNFDSSSNSLGNSPIIRERVSLISAHMYKQLCDYKHSSENTSEIFVQVAATLKDLNELLKKSFSSREVSTENIWVKIDTKVPAVVVNTFWHQFSFTMRCNFKPQALFRENEPAIYSGRIMAVKGDYFDLIKDTKTPDDEIAILLSNEIASLYVPENKMKDAIIKMKFGYNKEFPCKQIDVGREFAIAISETIYKEINYHEEGTRKQFNL